jgi:hemolysin III
MANFKEPVSGFIHLAGAVLSAVGLGFLLYHALTHGTIWHVVSYSIFGASLLALYTASTLYHLIPDPPVGVPPLKLFDHLMIYVLIAGTYTPLCLVALRGQWGWTLFGCVWALALGGMLTKVFWRGMPRWLSTLFYVLMGWLVVVATWPLSQSLHAGGLWWLLAGGLSYTGGAVIYGLKRPDPWPKLFGYHEIWHLFVLGGSACHYWMILRYVTPVR